MSLFESYVLRIYRKDGAEVAGVIEDVNTGRPVPFRSPEELWRAITGRPCLPAVQAQVYDAED